MSPRRTGEREVFSEITTLGRFAKASAIDAATGTEVSLMGPANAEHSGLKAAVLRKLEFVLKKRDEKA